MHTAVTLSSNNGSLRDSGHSSAHPPAMKHTIMTPQKNQWNHLPQLSVLVGKSCAMCCHTIWTPSNHKTLHLPDSAIGLHMESSRTNLSYLDLLVHVVSTATLICQKHQSNFIAILSGPLLTFLQALSRDHKELCPRKKFMSASMTST